MSESLPTNRTGERLLPSVSVLVSQQTNPSFEGLLTFKAFKMSLLRMNQLVNGAVGGLSESLPTVGAAERPVLGVNLLVLSEMH